MTQTPEPIDLTQVLGDSHVSYYGRDGFKSYEVELPDGSLYLMTPDQLRDLRAELDNALLIEGNSNRPTETIICTACTETQR